ncbi:MAG: tetratricopeptide repeat protein, partial [Terriglobia bacterium]
KPPEERYATAADLLVDLRNFRDRARRLPVPPAAAPGYLRRILQVAAALALAVAVVLVWLLWPPPPTQIQSLAVLPLKNLSGDPEQEYFADGMTDALIANLQKIQALRVISRTSVMSYKGVDKPLPQIARDLDVDGIIEGSVLRVGNRVRITIQLFHGPTEQNLWGERYERDLVDVLVLQSEVAQAIVREVEIQLTAQEEAQLASTRPVDPEAYEAYLKGRYEWNSRSAEGLNRAIGYFQQAIQQDSTYAQAYAGLADCYLVLAGQAELPPEEAYTQAKAAAARALEIDDTLAEAHTSLALIHMLHFDWVKAEEAFLRALERNPNYATAHHWYALYLSAMGRSAEALAHVRRARALDPVSPIISSNVAWCLYLARQYDQAIEAARRTIQDHPNFDAAHGYLGQAYLEKGMYEEAIVELKHALDLSGGGNIFLGEIGNAYAVAGRRTQARQMLAELTQRARERYVSPYDIALVHIGLGENERAFELLNQAVQERSSRFVNLKVHPRLDTLKSDPRFEQLLRRMDFPQPQTQP